MRKHTVPTPYMVGEVHFYSTEINGELVLFDTGPNTPEAKDYLQQNLDLARLKHVFITHCHVDHYGLAWYLEQQTAATIYLPQMDVRKFEYRTLRMQGLQRLLLDCGFDQDFVEGFRGSLDQNQIFPLVPQRFEIVEQSPVPARLGLSVLSCPGHSQSDLIFHNQSWAVTGDVLLRGIFQAPLLDLDLRTLSGRFNNYQAYCQSLRQFERLRGLEILPSHRDYVDSLEETILFYAGKLVERAVRIQALPAHWTVAEVLQNLPGKSADPFVAYLKASEILFMRDFLAQPELLLNALDHLGLRQEISSLLPLNLAC